MLYGGIVFSLALDGLVKSVVKSLKFNYFFMESVTLKSGVFSLES